MSNSEVRREEKLDVKIKKIAIAGLLHDIGKFWQRTSREKPFTQKEAECFQTYEHALWSWKFVENYIRKDDEIEKWVREHHDTYPSSIEAKVVKLADWLASGERREYEAKNEVASSSPAKAKYARLENIFDNLSEFNEFSDGRVASQIIEDGTVDDGVKKQKRPLPLSIIPPENYDLFFPKVYEQEQATCDSGYDDLWRKFEEDLEFLRSGSDSPLDLPVATWVSLLKKFTSRIPSATPFRKEGYSPDISLFQHCKITSAIAVCLAHNVKNGVLTEEDIERLLTAFRNVNNPECYNPDDYPSVATFLGGDISGIQEYLYSIPTKGAARQLKARSFLLQLICDFVAAYISEQLGLPPTNILYSSGGRFYILMPVLREDVNDNLPVSKKAFEGLLQRISKELLNYLKGDLHLVCATADVKIHHFKLGGFNEIWKEITGEISRLKQNKYSIFLASGPTDGDSSAGQVNEIYDLLFGPKDPKEYPSYNSTAGAEEEVSEATMEDSFMEKVGKRLRNAKFIVRRKVTGVLEEEKPAPLKFVNSLGYDYEFYLSVKDFSKNLDNVDEIISVNNFDPKEISAGIRGKVNSIPLNFRFYANYWPTYGDLSEKCKGELTSGDSTAVKGSEGRAQDSAIMFEDFAELSTGPKKIAIFRADVDSMGEVFKKGLGDNNTLSRSAMLSSAISEFFEGYVNYLAQLEEGEKKFKGYIGIVYSGGDDLFIVGSWDKVIEFALKLQDDFKEYSNFRLSISGGIVVVDATTPLRIVAKMAEDAETTAKNYRRCIPDSKDSERSKINSGREHKKDCIVLFDTPIGYEEKKELLEIKELLLDILRKDKGESNKGILRKLQSIFANYTAQKRLASFRKARCKATTKQLIKEVELERWRWLLLYSLRRYIKDKDKDKENRDTENIEKILELLLSSDLSNKRGYKIEDKVGAILRWVELLTRGK